MGKYYTDEHQLLTHGFQMKGFEYTFVGDVFEDLDQACLFYDQFSYFVILLEDELEYG